MIHLFQLYIHYPYPNDIPNSKYHIVPSSISEFLNISVASVHFLSIVSHSFCTFSQPKFTQVTRESWGNQPPWWWVGTLTPPFHCISWNYMELPPFFLSTIDSFFPSKPVERFPTKISSFRRRSELWSCAPENPQEFHPPGNDDKTIDTIHVNLSLCSLYLDISWLNI